MVEDLERLLFEEIPEMETPRIKRCEWCHEPLPNDRYHLKICPQCRKESISTFMKGSLKPGTYPAISGAPSLPPLSKK